MTLTFDLMTLETFSTMPTHMMNISAKFHWNSSTVNGLTVTDGRTYNERTDYVLPPASVVVWGISLVLISEVNLRRTRLVLGWVTVSPGSNPRAGNLSRYVTSHPGQLSLVIPLCVGALSTSQRAVTPCGWRGNAGMISVWLLVKLRDPLVLLQYLNG